MSIDRPIKRKILRVYGHEPDTLDDLAQCVIKMIDRRQKVVGFAWDISHLENIRNSHNAPEGYPDNFGNDKKLPTHYPGWSGRVWIRYAKPVRSTWHNMFDETLTHPGTGGIGTYNGPWTDVSSIRYYRYGRGIPKKFWYPEIESYSWDYKFYDLDWPLIAEIASKHKMWNILTNEEGDTITHEFKWTDPDTLKADKEFIEETRALASE